MKKIIVIGCPGSGKSTFSRELNKKTGISLYYLDMLYHKPDKTTCAREEFDEKLRRIMQSQEWIIDGNYERTLPIRIKQCDTVFWLDYPTAICLKGIEARRGRQREDMPWIETEVDEEFIGYIKSFKAEHAPKIEELLKQTEGKEIHIFTSREMAADYLNSLR